MNLILLQTYMGNCPGKKISVSERLAEILISKGIAKMFDNKIIEKNNEPVVLMTGSDLEASQDKKVLVVKKRSRRK